MHEAGKRNDGIYQYGQARSMDPEVRSLADWIGTSGAVDDRSDMLIIARMDPDRDYAGRRQVLAEVYKVIPR